MPSCSIGLIVILARLAVPAAAQAPQSAQPAQPAPPAQQEGNGAAADPAASAPAAPDAQQRLDVFLGGIDVSGLVDAYYGYNWDRVTGDAPLRNFDSRHNQFGFNLAEVALERKPTGEMRLGFRLDLGVGPTADTVHAFEPAGAGRFASMQQGYFSYLAPLGRGLQVDVGKFVTPLGAEVIESRENWNYSRSLLFALAIPYYHMGVRVAYPVRDGVTLAGYVVNGCNNVVDNNGAKTVGLQATLKPGQRLSIVQAYMTGREQTGDSSDVRHVLDTVVTFALTPAVSLMANWDFGYDRVDGRQVAWRGVAGYARWQATPWWALATRAERYADRDGFTTGLAQTVRELTITSEHQISGGLVTRLEFRRDTSDVPFFSKGNRLVPSQSTLTFGILYAFTTRRP